MQTDIDLVWQRVRDERRAVFVAGDKKRVRGGKVIMETLVTWRGRREQGEMGTEGKRGESEGRKRKEMEETGNEQSKKGERGDGD